MSVGVVIIGSGSLNTIESCANKGFTIAQLFYIGSKLNEQCIQKLERACEQPKYCHSDDTNRDSLFVNWLEHVDEVLFVAGLGGATVKQLLGHCMELAEVNDKQYALIYSLPAYFEGIRRASFAQATLKSLSNSIPKIRVENSEEQLDIVKYFKEMDERFFHAIKQYFVNKTLVDVESIMKKNEEMLQHSAHDYNIYKIMQIDKKELMITRVISDLLNPNGSHRQGAIFLSYFMEQALPSRHFSLEILKDAHVFKEYKVNNDVQIDIYIVIGETRIPIAIKINNKDEVKPIAEYVPFATGDEPTILYITPYGTKPSYNLNLQGNEKMLVCRSFETDMFEWLQCCVNYCHARDLSLIEGAIQQLLFSIESYTSHQPKGYALNVSKLLSSSSQQMKNAMIIEENLTKIKVNKLFDVFQAIEAKVGLRVIDNHPNYYKQQGILENYIDGKRDWLPGLYFHAGDVDGVPLMLCVETNWYLYAAFRLLKPSEELIEKAKLQLAHLSQGLNLSGMYWEYIPVTNKFETPMYSNPNSSDSFYLALYDAEYFDTYTTLCANRIRYLLSEVRELTI